MEVSALIQALAADSASQRRGAAERLAQMGADARPACLALVRAVGDDDEEVVEWSAAALEEVGPPPVESAEALAGLLSDGADVGYWAATLLGRLGPAAAGTVPHLSAALRSSPHATVRQRAAWALGQLGGAAKAAQTALDEATRSDDARLARLARQALEEIGN